jgi:hypothetical protein
VPFCFSSSWAVSDSGSLHLFSFVFKLLGFARSEFSGLHSLYFEIHLYNSSMTTSPFIFRSSDLIFYSEPRFVTHIDVRAIRALTDYYSKVFPPSNTPGVTMLDLCSSWVCHFSLCTLKYLLFFFVSSLFSFALIFLLYAICEGEPFSCWL